MTECLRQGCLRHLEEVFEARVAVYVAGGDGQPRSAYATAGFEPPADEELAVLSSEGTTHAEWAGRMPAPGTFAPHVHIPA